MDPAGKTAIVTGGNSGLGRATSVALAKEGVRVVIAARSKAKADETLRLIEDVAFNPDLLRLVRVVQ